MPRTFKHALKHPVRYSTGRVEVKVVELLCFEKMSNEEKIIHIIEFLSKKADWESWS